MMNVDPFWLNDRIVPSDANDPKEVTRLGQALSDVGEDVADRSRPAVTEAVRRFQDSRGLRVDGEAQVNGPTAQRLAAERHERQTAARPSAQQRILGEQHSVPVRDSVGTGARNRPEDRRSVMQALAIGNYLSRYAALNPADLPPGAPDPELETALARFRRKQGVRETGPLAPGSLTLRLLNQITAPRLHQLIGDDVARPRDMSPVEDPAVVRDSPDSPTARAVPFRDEGQVAHETAQDQEIARRQADRIHQEMAAVDRGEAAPVPGTDPSLQALHDDPELKDMTARQIARIREIATESALDLEMPETRARLGAYMREKEPDFLTALQEKYEAGKLDARKLERLTENWARQVSTHGASPISVARLRAGTEVLRQALQDEGASAADTVAKIEKLMAGAGQGEPEVPLLFEFFPGLGEALSAADAAKYLAQAQAADAAGNTAEANAAWNAFALAAAGAVPFVGKAVKLLRHVKVVRKAEEAINSAAAPVLNAITEQARKTKVVQKAEELVDAQRARRKLLKAKEDFETEFEGMSAQELVGAADWSKLDEKTQNAISSSFTHGKRRASEGQLATDLDVAGAKRPLDGSNHDHLYMVRTDDGEWLPRKFDSVAYGWFRPALMGLWVRKIDEGKAFAIELKSGSSKLTTKQARADKAIAEGRDTLPTLSKEGGRNGYTLPEIEKDIKHLRIPLWAIPQDMLNEDLRKSLTDKGTPERVITKFLEELDKKYKHADQLLKKGDTDIASTITIGAVFTALSQIEFENDGT